MFFSVLLQFPIFSGNGWFISKFLYSNRKSFSKDSDKVTFFHTCGYVLLSLVTFHHFLQDIRWTQLLQFWFLTNLSWFLTFWILACKLLHTVGSNCKIITIMIKQCTLDQDCVDGGTLLHMCGWTLLVHSPGSSTFLHEITSWPSCWMHDIMSKIGLCQSIHIYLKNNAAKFHPNLIWNDGTLGFF